MDILAKADSLRRSLEEEEDGGTNGTNGTTAGDQQQGAGEDKRAFVGGFVLPKPTVPPPLPPTAATPASPEADEKSNSGLSVFLH